MDTQTLHALDSLLILASNNGVSLNTGFSFNDGVSILLTVGGGVVVWLLRTHNAQIRDIKSTITEASAVDEKLNNEKNKTITTSLNGLQNEMSDLKNTTMKSHREEMSFIRNELMSMLKSVATDKDIERIDKDMTELKKEVGNVKRDYISETTFTEFKRNCSFVHDRREQKRDIRMVSHDTTRS